MPSVRWCAPLIMPHDSQANRQGSDDSTAGSSAGTRRARGWTSSSCAWEKTARHLTLSSGRPDVTKDWSYMYQPAAQPFRLTVGAAGQHREEVVLLRSVCPYFSLPECFLERPCMDP